MKTIIAGLRDYRAREIDTQYLDQEKDTITEVLCGCATGADEFGRRWAVANGIPVRKFPADWDRFGKSAGPIRNRKMTVYADRLIAFWDGKSLGTKNMIDVATKRGLRVTVIRVDDAAAKKSGGSE